MLHFQCPNCGQRLYFENSQCTHCGAVAGFDLDAVAFRQTGPGHGWRFCANAAEGACNWALPDAAPRAFCLSCRLNEIVPPVGDPVHRRRWADVEGAKRRLVYGLVRLGLPVIPRADAPDGLAFRILVDDRHGGAGEVSMGHEHGVITIDASEADSPERESRRVELGEPIRTMLGHMRHESGHYYWDRLVGPTPWLDGFRALFGDERTDYAEAMRRHYSEGPPGDWQGRFISAYATMHPWEDWAESWAHYLHMVDAVETAAASGFGPPVAADRSPAGADFDTLYQRWQDIFLAMNAMNRSLGHHDFYPFVVGEGAREKLAFIHRLVASPAPS